MDLKDFSYHLPADLIAQHPRPERDASAMLAINRETGALTDARFSQFPDFLKKGDVLVINDSKVIPARLYGKKATGALVELLLINRKETEGHVQTWETLLRPAKRIAPGDHIDLGHGCHARVLERLTDKKWLLDFESQDGFDRHLEQYGRAPLPPYIKRTRDTGIDTGDDRSRYQTIYAKNDGSIAAPTAGLHFSKNVLDALSASGVEIAPVTLHVGIGTFLPIETQTVEDHRMETEYYDISAASAEKINSAGRVIAVGTTSTRALESAADEKGLILPQCGQTRLFIYPGFRFKRVNALLTNFHLPESSLFLLVCAFAGQELMQQAYLHAVEHRYRFYSYGDCMLIE